MASLLEAAFRHAQEAGLPLLLAHKANIIEHGHGLWLRVFESLRGDFPAVPARGMHADALARPGEGSTPLWCDRRRQA